MQRSPAMFVRLILVGLMLWVLSGCESSIPSAEPGTEAPTFTGALNLDVPTALRLTNYRRELHLGEPVQDALNVFPRPARSYPFQDLPLGLEAPFEAKGWEQPKDGFGVIAYDGQVALALRQYEQLDNKLVDGIVQQVKDANRNIEPKLIQTERATHLMWIDGDYRLLVSYAQVSKSATHLVIALGESSLMDFLNLKPGSDVPKLNAAPVEKSPEPPVENAPLDVNAPAEINAPEINAPADEKAPVENR